MPSVQFTIDFGEPDGDLEAMGCEDFKNAQEVIDAMKSEGRHVKDVLDDWCLLDMGEVTVTYTPDIPADLGQDTLFDPESPEPFTQKRYAAIQNWLKENRTKASWSDWDHHKKGDA